MVKRQIINHQQSIIHYVLTITYELEQNIPWIKHLSIKVENPAYSKTLLEWTSVDQNCWHQVSKNIGNFKAFIVVVKSKIISIVFKDNTWNFENLKNFQTWQLVACNYKTQAREPLWQFSVNNMQPIPLFSRDVFIRAQVFSCKSSEIMKKYNNYCAIAKLHRFDEIWKIELWKLMSF